MPGTRSDAATKAKAVDLPALSSVGVPVTRCTGERLMERNGWRGVVRANRALDLLPGRDPGPLNAAADVEHITATWHRLGRRPPAEAEADHT